MRTLVLGLVWFAIAAAPAQGALITYTFTGTFTNVVTSTLLAPPIVEPVSVGDPFTAYITVDTAVPDTDLAVVLADYRNAVVDIGFTSHTFTRVPTSDVLNTVQVVDNVAGDTVNLFSSFSGTEEGFRHFYVFLQDVEGVLLSSTDFPLAIDVSLLEFALLQITTSTSEGAATSFVGEIDTVAVSEGPVGSVPEPVSTLLVGIGLAGGAIAYLRKTN